MSKTIQNRIVFQESANDPSVSMTIYYPSLLDAINLLKQPITPKKLKEIAPVPDQHPSAPEDVLLSIYPEYMDEITLGVKTFEFRKHRCDNISRFWFYNTAPISAVVYVCEVGPVRTRNPGDEPLPEGPIGNKEYNDFHPDWDKYDYAYEIHSVYKIKEPIKLETLESQYGWKGIPKGLPLAPLAMVQGIDLQEQEKVWSAN